MREKLTVSTWFARVTIRYIFAFRRDAICRGDLERAEGIFAGRRVEDGPGNKSMLVGCGSFSIGDGEIPAR